MMQDDASYAVADVSHINGFLALQEKNLLIYVPEEMQSGGFVTTPFTAEQLASLIAEKGICVALHNGQVIGYVVSASWQFLSIYPIFRHMVMLLPTVNYFSEVVNEYNSYQYGPVCIDREWRGTGVFETLFAYARQHMARHYPYALTFVNSRNHRSRDAHLRKLGLAHLCDFTFNEQTYHMIGFETAK